MESISDSTDTGERQPEEKGKPSLAYWRSQLQAYDNAADPWRRDIDDAFDEYLHSDRRGKSGDKKTTTHFPLFWACVRTIQPAFYSRTPVIVTEKTFREMRDAVARLASVGLERLGKFLVKTSGFDRSMSLAVTHFIMAEKASLRVIFDSAISETRTRYQERQYEYQGTDGHIMLGKEYVDERGEVYHGEVEQDESGEYYSSEQSIDYMTCETEVMHYKDYRHTPNARHDGEIDWISFDTLLTRSEVEDTFGAEVANEITFTPIGQSKDKDRSREMKGLPAHYATITEIWDKKKRRVYYLSPGYNEWLKHKNNPEGEDPYKLKNFFPRAPFILGTHGPDDLFTSPAFVQLKDFIDQVHGAFDRVRRLVLALKKAGVYDASKGELAELNAIASEGQFIGIQDLEALLGPNGTLDKLIHFFPTEKIAQGVNELKTAMLELEQKLYDLWGIPDIYRGISDPNETLGAQQLKGKHMSVRFSVLQREVQRLARDTIEIMCDLYLDKCPDFKLAEIMGVQFMTQEEQALFPQALALLKNDTERCIRIEIETDSTITQNLNADIEQKNYLAKTFFEGLAALKDVNPAFMPVAAKAVEIGVKALQQGKQIEGELEQALDAMQQAANQPPPPPPQDNSVQVATIKAQVDGQKIQADMQQHAADLQIKAQELQLEFQKLQLEGQKLIQAGQLEQLKLSLEQQIAGATTQLDGLRVQIEQYKAVLDEREKFIEEARLKNEDSSDHRGHLVEAIAALTAAKEASAAAKPQPVPAIHVHAGPGGDGKPKKRKVKITQNEDGSAADIEEVFEDIETDG